VLRDDVDASVRLRCKLDRTFRRPEAYFHVNIVTSALCATPRSWVLAVLTARLLEDDLKEQTYDAAESRVCYKVRASNQGFSLDVLGLSDKLPVLLRLVVDHLANLRADPDCFSCVLEVLHHGFKNVANSSPLSHAGTVTSLLLYPTSMHKTSGLVRRRARMRPPAPTPTELEAFLASVCHRGVFIEVLVTGSVRPAAALAMTAVVEDALHAPPLRARTPCVTCCRASSPETITDRILACLDGFGADTLPKMDPTPFKAAVMTTFREPAKQLSLETGRFLWEIDDHTYNFGRRAAEADALEGVDTETLLRLWETHLAADAPQRRMLVATVHPPQHPPALTPTEERAAGGVGGGDALTPIVVDVVAAYPAAVRAFRNSRPLYPSKGYCEPGATGFST